MPIVVPVTRTRFTGPLFPVLAPGVGGLPAHSTVLAHQVLAIDGSRLLGRLGRLSPDEYQPIRHALTLMFAQQA
jgi:mRNA-degrading endonuclease toxin of MazEF toxin-antitoxin module